MIRFLISLAVIVLFYACTSGFSSSNQVGNVATGMLKTRDYIITLYATQNSPLYSVRTLDGTLLQEEISIETMVAQFPELEYLQNNDNISWAGLDGIAPRPANSGLDP